MFCNLYYYLIKRIKEWIPFCNTALYLRVMCQDNITIHFYKIENNATLSELKKTASSGIAPLEAVFVFLFMNRR